MRDSMLMEIYNQMKIDSSIFFLTADFGSPVLDKIRQKFSSRFINVGVAEQNLINISSGLALEGFKVFCYAIAPFITMRCFEQLRINLSLLSQIRNLNVNLIGVGAGYSYVVSGPTHQCYEDISLIRNLPNFEIYSCSDQNLSRSIVKQCISQKSPKYIRLDAQVLPNIRKNINKEVLKKGYEIIKKGEEILIISTGFMTHTALKISKYIYPKYNISIIDLFNLTGFNKSQLSNLIKKYKFLFTIEEGFINRAGLDSVISELTYSKDIKINHRSFGVVPSYSFELGTREQLHKLAKIDFKSISKKIIGYLESLN